MIIDTHTHIFPNSLAVKALKALEKSGSIKPYSDGTVASLKKSMKEACIDYSVVLPIATKPGHCKTINDFAIAVNKEPGLISLGSVHPLDANWKEELVRIKKNGITGIKIHPDFQGMYIDDDRMIELIEEATRLGLTITIHCGADISFKEVHCTPERVASVAHCVRGSKIVAAHMGGYDYLDDSEKHIIGTDMYIDVSFVLGKFPDEQICRMLNNHNEDKIFFGSDSPWDSQTESVKRLMKLDISNNLKEKILCKNAKSFYGL